MRTQSVDPRHLRSALEYAVLMASEGQKLRPPLKFPAGLRKYMAMNRIPTGALPAVRRLVEGDQTFRERIAVGAVPELVDEIGRLWLRRDAGWEHELARLIGDAEVAEEAADAAKALRKADKRRVAAERATARAQAEIAVLSERVTERNEVIDGLRADVVKLAETVDELRAELADTRTEARHARDREQAALAKQVAAESALDAAVVARGEAEHVRDDVLADRAGVAAERSELARLAAAAEALATQLADLVSPVPGGRPSVRRRALPMPGGVMGDSAAAAEFLFRSGASILVDGYNVAKLAWPNLDLAGQRVVLLDAMENLVRRHGSDVTVVFDGADVVGAVADGRRVVRVVFSPADVIADDVIRDEVRRLPASRPVVVVTNDQAIVRDVKALGANTMSSEQLLDLVR